MTILNDEKRISKIDSMNRTWRVRVLTLQCDMCNKIFEYSGPNVSRKANRKNQYCSTECANIATLSGNPTRIAIENTCYERFGVSSPLGSKECQEKSKQTCLQKYGVHHPGAVPELIQRRQTTCLDRYGKITFLASDECRKILESDIVKENHRIAIEKIDWVARNKKTHETKKRNGTYAKQKSIPEDKVYELLCERFGIDDIERHKLMNDLWPVDLYVKSIDTYVQYDGSWHHGVGKTLEEVQDESTPWKKSIHQQMLRDIRQNEWFAENNLRLVRIRGVLLKQLTNEYVNSLF